MTELFTPLGIILEVGTEPPIELPTLPRVPTFDLNLLPDRIRPYVEDVALRQGCPVDFVAVAAMVALSGAIGRRRSLAAKLLDDWTVFANLWGMLVGRPSSMKSPALNAATAPLHQLEAASNQLYDEALKKFELELQLHKLTAKSAENSAKQKAKSDHDAALAELVQHQSSAPVAPKRQRLVINDPSVEKLQEIMADNDLGVLLLRDELSGWLQKMEYEENAEARSFYLAAKTGREPFIVDRIGRGTIRIPAACLSIIGGIQPSKVSRVIQNAVSGVSDDGLIQRFQIVTWPDDRCDWKWRDRPPHLPSKMAYEEVFAELYSLSFEKTPLRQTAAAQDLFRNWWERHQQAVQSSDLHPTLQSHLIKMPEAILSLALICQLVDAPGASEVGEAAMKRAIAWSEYLLPHAERLYHTANLPEVEAAHMLLRKKAALGNSFTARDVIRKGWTGMNKAEVVNKALELLVDHKFLHAHPVVHSGNGGRPTVQFSWTWFDMPTGDKEPAA